jgi:transcriptional regulator of acetoin/glycerol metabolism
VRPKPDWFEMAQRGTLFLDEVSEMAAKTQVDLLRVLEQPEVRRLGSQALIPLDVRLVTATHRDVDELLAEGKLREDLHYRLNVVPLRVPPCASVPTTSPHWRKTDRRKTGWRTSVTPAVRISRPFRLGSRHSGSVRARMGWVPEGLT